MTALLSAICRILPRRAVTFNPIRRFAILIILTVIAAASLSATSTVAAPSGPTAVPDETADIRIARLEEELRIERAGHERILRRTIIALTVVSLVSILAIEFIYEYRRRQRDNYYMNVAENVREVVSVSRDSDNVSRRLMHELLLREYSQIDSKLRDYYSHSSAKTKKDLADEVKSFITRFSSPEGLAEMEETVNKYQSGVMAEFRKDFPSLKPVDYQLFLYIVLGFSPTAISLFMNVDKLESIYNRKSRLKAKIRALESGHNDIYLMYI